MVQRQFHVEIRNQDRATVVEISGELDLASSAALEEALTRAVESDLDEVIVDLRELEFMDSTGLSTLVRAHHRAQAAGRRFALVRGTQQVQRLLTLTGVADRLELGESPEALLRSA